MVKQAAGAADAADAAKRSRFSGTGEDMATEINYSMNGKKTAVKYGEEGELGASKLDKKAINANEPFLKACFKLQQNFSFNEKKWETCWDVYHTLNENHAMKDMTEKQVADWKITMLARSRNICYQVGLARKRKAQWLQKMFPWITTGEEAEVEDDEDVGADRFIKIQSRVKSFFVDSILDGVCLEM